jgi:hypothetical protein
MTKLRKKRLVQPKLFANAVDCFWSCLVAGDDRRGIAGNEIEKREYKDGYDGHHRDGGKDAAGYVSKHSKVSSVICAGMAIHASGH